MGVGRRNGPAAQVKAVSPPRPSCSETVAHMANLHDELRLLNPSPTNLLRWLAPQIDDGMLREIAQEDCGCDVDLHFAALRHIRENLEVPAPLAWEPKEVLELVRWSEPDDPPREPSGHLTRAFCCTALLLAATDPENDTILSENETIIQLVLSSIALGTEACNRAVEFLAWRLLCDPYDEEEHPFFAVALLLLRTHLYRAEDSTSDLLALCEWARVEEARLRKELGCATPDSKDDYWLLGLVVHDQRHSAWQSAAATYLSNPPPAMPDDVRARLQDIGELLCKPRISGAG